MDAARWIPNVLLALVGVVAIFASIRRIHRYHCLVESIDRLYWKQTGQGWPLWNQTKTFGYMGGVPMFLFQFKDNPEAIFSADDSAEIRSAKEELLVFGKVRGMGASFRRSFIVWSIMMGLILCLFAYQGLKHLWM